MSEQELGDDWRETMACRICKYALNVRIPRRGGPVEFLHGRPELDLDHDPEPVPRSQLADIKMVCDFCKRPDPTWNVHAEQIDGFRAPDGGMRDFSPDWAACPPCAQLVRRRDMEGLIDRVFHEHCRQNGISIRERSTPGFREYNAERWRHQYGLLFPLVHWVRPLLREPLSMDDIPPAKLPKVRDRLARLWGDPKLAEGYVDQQSRGGIILPGIDAGDEDAFAVNAGVLDAAPHAFCRRMQVATQVADLYWISAGFTRLAMGAGNKLTDLTITRDEMPAANGLLAWESPVQTIAGVSGSQADVFAVGWTLVPGGMWLVAYVRTEEFFDDGRYADIQEMRERTGWFFPASCGAGIPFDIPARPADGDTRQSYDLIGTLFATWHLMRQGGIAEQTTELPDKATRRAYGRARRPIPEVRVVNLRSRARAPRMPADGLTTTRAAWSYRVMVGGTTGGFWRTYWTGPGRAVKEQRWIEPYLTGDDSLPMKEDLDVQIVKTLK